MDYRNQVEIALNKWNKLQLKNWNNIVI
jgi:hypothetical protein